MRFLDERREEIDARLDVATVAHLDHGMDVARGDAETTDGSPASGPLNRARVAPAARENLHLMRNSTIAGKLAQKRHHLVAADDARVHHLDRSAGAEPADELVLLRVWHVVREGDVQIDSDVRIDVARRDFGSAKPDLLLRRGDEPKIDGVRADLLERFEHDVDADPVVERL